MCGVAAIYAYKQAAPVADRDELRRIRDHMTARGPDGKGEWYSDDRRVALGHRRLAIIDPDARAAQPMLSPDGKLAVVFNGEVYNFRELRTSLERAGHRFHTESDTEVLLHLYAEKQEAMLHDLRGMFTFIIWDVERQRMFLARDPYGIKPLYYADDGWTLRAASQVKALLAGGKIAQDPEPAGIVGFHLFGSVPEPFTLYQGIRQLPAGHYLWADEKGSSEPRAWFSIAGELVDDDLKSGILSIGDIRERAREALLDSVKAHLVADVPVGAFLSAGIDSGGLVGLMRDAGQQHIRTVTLAFEEFRGQYQDEAPLAVQVARQYETDHQVRWVSRQEFQQDLPFILAVMDQPSIDGVNHWFVSKAAAEQGLKVAVSGLGGDELFGGYPSFRDIPRWVSQYRLPSRIPGLGIALRRCASVILPFTPIQSPKAAGMVEYGGTWEGAWLLRRGLFMPWELPTLLGRDLAREGLRRLQPLKMIRQSLEPMPGSSFGRVAAMENSLYMRNQLLRDADWSGMAHSLEIRVPLVDSRLLRDCASLIAQAGPAWNKTVLANAPRKPLPDSVAMRVKTGFTLPMRDWMNDTGVNAISSEPHARSDAQHWSRQWALHIYRSSIQRERCKTA